MADSLPVRNGKLGHPKNVIQPLRLPRVEGLEAGTAATTATGAAKATTAATTSTTVTTTTAAVEATATATTTTVATTAATAAHAKDVGGDVHEGTGADEGRVGSVELGCQLVLLPLPPTRSPRVRK